MCLCQLFCCSVVEIYMTSSNKIDIKSMHNIVVDGINGTPTDHTVKVPES